VRWAGDRPLEAMGLIGIGDENVSIHAGWVGPRSRSRRWSFARDAAAARARLEQGWPNAKDMRKALIERFGRGGHSFVLGRSGM